MSLLGIDEEKLNKFNFVSNVFDRMKNFYENDAERIKKKISEGSIRVYIPYDIDLTLEEACLKYAKCDIKTAERISEMMSKTRRKADIHEKEIRDNYRGDLAKQLNFDDIDYTRFKRINKNPLTFHFFEFKWKRLKKRIRNII